MTEKYQFIIVCLLCASAAFLIAPIAVFIKRCLWHMFGHRALELIKNSQLRFIEKKSSVPNEGLGVFSDEEKKLIADADKKLLITKRKKTFALRKRLLRLIENFERSPSGIHFKLFVFLGCLIASILCMRYAVGLYEISVLNAGEALTPFEEFFNSFVHSLRIFSIDDSFDEYIHRVKSAMAGLFGADSALVIFYGGYASILNSAAPVAGGAIIFEILASIFPSVRLRVSYWKIWREKYYFSELNENTLALIRSINEAHKKKFRKPVAVITDSYIDDENERSAELLNEAKSLGAICVKNDIVHIRKNYFGKRKIFLIDEDEGANVRTLVDISRTMKRHYVKKTEFYMFASNEAYAPVEKEIRSNFVFGERDETPVIIPVNGYRNIIANMFSDLPLFEPIVHEYAKKREEGKETELNITVLGTGRIGTEMFLGTYWCSQILGCKPHITVVSMESRKEFEQKINYINPEIFRSMNPDDPLLLIYRDEKFAPKGAPVMSEPYCSFSYKNVDVRSDEFFGLIEEDEDIGKTDYFFVALGSDDENISMANKLRETIGHGHLLNGGRKTVITYVVYDPTLCEALNGKTLYSYSKDGNDIYMKAVGSIDDVYSVKNVFMTDAYPLAKKAHEAYYSSKEAAERKTASKSMAKDEYSYRSSMARAVHTKYKVFSSGLWKSSVFDGLKNYGEIKESYMDEYVKLITELAQKQDLGLLHDLAWLEHRRWNAFLRSRGFRGPHMFDDGGNFDPTATIKYMKQFLSVFKQKNLELKRHLCIAECDRFGIKADVGNDGKMSEYKLWKLTNDENSERYAAAHPDMLDEMMIQYAYLSKLSFRKQVAVAKKVRIELDNILKSTKLFRIVKRSKLKRRLDSKKNTKLYIFDYKEYDYPHEELGKQD